MKNSWEYTKMLGYDPLDVCGDSTGLVGMYPPDDRERVQQIYRDYIGGSRGKHQVEFRQHTPQGDRKWPLSDGNVVKWDERTA